MHVIALAFAFIAWILGATAAWAAPSTSAAVQVRVAEIQSRALNDRIQALGTLRANESIAITSHVTETISALRFEDGQRVRAGDLLVELTSAEERALLDEARVRAGEAQRQYRRVESLVAQGSASESLLDERRRDLETTRALLSALESRLADRLIKAPFDGILGLRDISRGALVEPGDRIATLDDDSLMKLDFPVPSVHLGALAPGLTIEARNAAFGERLFSGLVRGIDSRVDPVTRSIKVRAILPNPEGLLKPGLLMRVTLMPNPREALMAPEAAILHRGRDHFVMRARETGQGALVAEHLPVEIGARLPGWVEIRSGLNAGDRLVTHGGDRLRDGQAIAILEAGPDSPAAQAVADAAP